MSEKYICKSKFQVYYHCLDIYKIPTEKSFLIHSFFLSQASLK